MKIRLFFIFNIMLCFAFFAAETTAIDIPLQTWVKRDLTRYVTPYGGKHMRLAHNPDDGLIYLFGGDYSGTPGGDSGRNELFSYSVNDDVWTLVHGYCLSQGDFQPMHPDETGWIYDTTRDLFWMIPGYQGADQGHCQSTMTRGEIMTFNPATKKWGFPDRTEAFVGGGSAKFAQYDPITDTIIRFTGGDQVDVYNIGDDSWTEIDVPGTVDGAEYSAIDIEGRVVYFIYPEQGWLYSFHIDKKKLTKLSDTPRTGLHNMAMPVWDSANNVLLYPYYSGYGGRNDVTAGYYGFITLYVYHPDTDTWKAAPMTQPEGLDVRGNAAVFDPIQNVLMIMGGRNSWELDDNGNPLISSNPYLFLYRYGNGEGTPPDTTPPTVPQGLITGTVSGSQVDLSWQASTDAESGISSYTIYRDNVHVGTSSSTSYSDTDLTEGTTYSYQVSAISAGGESDKSTSVSATTLADTTPPSISSVSAIGDSNKVIITFSEPVEEASATTVSNYHIDNNITVSKATLGADLKTVTLTTSEHSQGTSYTLTVNSINDRASVPNTVLPDTQGTYTFIAALLISNLSVISGENYVWDTLDVGKQPYIDRSFTIATVPSAYIGLSYLKTANNDKGATDNPFITFDVNQPVTVYVAHSVNIIPKPSWLTSWTDTSEDLVTSDTTLRLYKKNFMAGTVTIGGNEGGGLSMYSVVVKSASGTNDTTTPSPPTGLRKM